MLEGCTIIVKKFLLVQTKLNKVFQRAFLMKRILYVSNTGKIIGGGEISLLNLLTHLDYKRFLPIVAVPEEGDFVDRLRDQKIAYLLVDLPTIRSTRIDRIMLSILHLIKLLRRYQIDLIHANGSRSMLLAGLASFILGIPCLWHLRVPDQTDQSLDRCLFILAKKIIVISSATMKRLSWTRQKQKIRLIPNGVDIELFHPINKKHRSEISAELGVDPKYPIVSTICQLTHQKHVDVFIKAVSHISPIQPHTQFIICGREVSASEGYKKMLENLAKRLGVKNKLVFTGFRSDIHKIFGATDIFVLSSVNEGFGRVIIEAMATELPVIATRSGGVPDIIKHGQTGYMFEPGDYISLGELIIHLLENKECAENISKAARDRVIKNFSITSHVENVQALYDEVLKG